MNDTNHESLILKNIEDGILTLTINRPKQLNALNSRVISELSREIDSAEKNFNIKVIILTGAGEKAFVAGADIVEFSEFSPQEAEKLASLGQTILFNKIETTSKPVIAAVNGFALGGGLELAMAAHIRIASLNAKLGLPEVSLGVIPGYGGTQRLAQLVGKGKALEMILSGGMISAEEGAECGLINKVVDQDILLDTVISLAKKIKRNAPTALSAAIKCVLAGYTDGVDGFEIEVKEFSQCFGTDDFREGTSAFIEKRHAKFPGK
jgi:enoyl-CoA hydratase